MIKLIMICSKTDEKLNEVIDAVNDLQKDKQIRDDLCKQAMYGQDKPLCTCAADWAVEAEKKEIIETLNSAQRTIETLTSNLKSVMVERDNYKQEVYKLKRVIDEFKTILK